MLRPYRIAESRNRSVLVHGLGKSGRAVVDLLALNGFRVRAIDENPTAEIIDYMERAMEMGVAVCTGRLGEREFEKADFIVVSPGIPPSNHIITSASRKNLPVLSEFEVAWQLIRRKPFKTIAVTGTNGKSTVVRLLGDIFAESQRKCVVGGNIGTPLAAIVNEIDENTVLVLEISSFQLFYTDTFLPDVSVILNITQDHLDWHSDFKDYTRSKGKLLALTSKNGYCILNADDENVIKVSDMSNGKNVWFTVHKKDTLTPPKAFFRNGMVMIDDGKSQIPVVERDLFAPMGFHNDYNLLAAAAAAYFSGATTDEIKKGTQSFKPLPHRMEKVNSYKGIEFIDDSKATNPDAVIKALEGMNKTCVVILGGKNKGNEFSEVALKIKEKCVGTVTLGEAAPEIESYLQKKGVTFIRACDMEDAVKKATLLLVFAQNDKAKQSFNFKAESKKIDNILRKAFSEVSEKVAGTVLLSPGCASFDMFENYSERGKAFREGVRKTLELMGFEND